MTYNQLQEAWQSQPDRLVLTLDADLLLKEVQRNSRRFELDVLKRDKGEVISCILLALFFAYVSFSLDAWMFWFMVPCCIYFSLFIAINRKMQKGKQGKPSESLDSCIHASLVQLEHQMWLVDHLIVLFLLPLGSGFIAVFSSMLWQIARDGCTVPWVWAFLVGCILFIIGVLIAIYYANQKWFKEELVPRRQELLDLLGSIRSTPE
ncbi:hypothetical protein ACFL6U_09960 [Planctomycetota bacterium]